MPNCGEDSLGGTDKQSGELKINFQAFTSPEGQEITKFFKLLGERTECLPQMQKSLNHVTEKFDNAIKAIESNKQGISRVEKAHDSLVGQVKKNFDDINRIKTQLPSFSSQSKTDSSGTDRPDWEHKLAITGLTDECIADPLLILNKISSHLLIPFFDIQIDDFKVLPAVKGKQEC